MNLCRWMRRATSSSGSIQGEYQIPLQSKCRFYFYSINTVKTCDLKFNETKEKLLDIQGFESQKLKYIENGVDGYYFDLSMFL